MLKARTEKTRTAFHVFKGYLFSQGLKYADVVIGIVAAALILLCWLFRMSPAQVFTPSLDITLGYSAKQDEQGLYYVIDDGRNRLICFDEDANIRYFLGGVDSLYFSDFAVEDGYVYDSLGITAKQGLARLLEEFHLNEMTSERFKEYFRKEIEKEG